MKPDDALKVLNRKAMLLYIRRKVNLNSLMSEVSGFGDPSYMTLSQE